MNKTQKMKIAARNTRKRNIKQWLKKVILFPWNLCKRIWAWLKKIDIVGMVNLTLLVAIIVLFTSLILNVINRNQINSVNNNGTIIAHKINNVDNRKVNQRKIVKLNKVLPLKVNPQTGIKPQIKTVGVKKPEVVKQISLPAKVLPKQNLTGDVIVDLYPSAPVLSNGVKIDGNLFIQNMRKYTLPCDAKIRGNLFIRNVDKLSFCGQFSVKGNIYVSKQSSFGPIPRNANIGGQVIL